jgi:hypothetical protein
MTDPRRHSMGGVLHLQQTSALSWRYSHCRRLQLYYCFLRRTCNCSRRSLRRIHQCGSYGSSKMAAGWPRPGRLSNSPASIAARILFSATICMARSESNVRCTITVSDQPNMLLVKHSSKRVHCGRCLLLESLLLGGRANSLDCSFELLYSKIAISLAICVALFNPQFQCVLLRLFQNG